MFRRRDRRDKAETPDSAPAADAGIEIDEFEDGEAVEEDAEQEDQPEDMTADLESQAADYLADNDVWMYGPNAEAVLEKRGWPFPGGTENGPGRQRASSGKTTRNSAATSSSPGKPSERGWP